MEKYSSLNILLWSPESYEGNQFPMASLQGILTNELEGHVRFTSETSHQPFGYILKGTVDKDFYLDGQISIKDSLPLDLNKLEVNPVSKSEVFTRNLQELLGSNYSAPEQLVQYLGPSFTQAEAEEVLTFWADRGYKAAASLFDDFSPSPRLTAVTPELHKLVSSDYKDKVKVVSLTSE